MLVERLRWQSYSGWQGAAMGASADLVLYFGPAEQIEAAAAPVTLGQRFPGALLLGCSTATGVIDNEIDETGLVGVACKFHNTRLRLVEAEVAGVAGSADTGRQLGEALQGDELAAVLVLADGTNVNGSALTRSLVDVLGDDVAVTGGLAADGARFTRTVVGAGQTVREGRAAALGFYGDAIRMTFASAGGWDPFGPRRQVTRAHGCVLEELDGKPALALYETYLGEEAAGLPGTSLFFPLMIWDPKAPEQTRTRTVLGIDQKAGTMTFAGDVPQGWGAQLMRGSLDRLVDDAARAAICTRDAAPHAYGSQALALLISCVGRRLMMGQRTAEELHAVADSLGPDTIQVGFYSHGEIAPNDGCREALLKNQTMVISMLTEVP